MTVQTRARAAITAIAVAAVIVLMWIADLSDPALPDCPSPGTVPNVIRCAP